MEDNYKIVASILGVIVAFFLNAWFIMLCWNAIIPTIFGLMTITYKQSTILLVLCNLLFKGSYSKD